MIVRIILLSIPPERREAVLAAGKRDGDFILIDPALLERLLAGAEARGGCAGCGE